jgi:putative molybdopterin biosynthesis protein
MTSDSRTPGRAKSKANTAGEQVSNRIGELRQKSGLPAAALAKTIGVSRQTIYEMEAGSYVPNTAIALRLARALQVRVEDLFELQGTEPSVTVEVELPHVKEIATGAAVQLCRVDQRMIAVPAQGNAWQLPPSDGVLLRADRTYHGAVKLFQSEEPANRVLLAGCDPATSVLARYLQRAGVDLVIAPLNSTQALEMLKSGMAHIAGTHLVDVKSGEANLPIVNRMFSKGGMTVITFAVWEEGIVVARGNPKGIRSVADLARADLRFTNREQGAGSRILLDAELRRVGMRGTEIQGYETTSPGHLSAAWQVTTGASDCCVATKAAANAFGLDFLPLCAERYDYVLRKEHLDWAPMQRLLNVLADFQFRRELEGVGGYDTSSTGNRLM